MKKKSACRILICDLRCGDKAAANGMIPRTGSVCKTDFDEILSDIRYFYVLCASFEVERG